MTETELKCFTSLISFPSSHRIFLPVIFPVLILPVFFLLLLTNPFPLHKKSLLTLPVCLFLTIQFPAWILSSHDLVPFSHFSTNRSKSVYLFCSCHFVKFTISPFFTIDYCNNDISIKTSIIRLLWLIQQKTQENQYL